MLQEATNQRSATAEVWPALPLDAWRETYGTLHMLSQIIGKIRLAQAIPVNHWWHVTLHLTSRGLTTLPMPCGGRSLQIDFDFIAHQFLFATSDGGVRSLELKSRAVANTYQEIQAVLSSLGIQVPIWPVPVEVADPIPFEKDTRHAAYDPVYAQRFWRILSQASRVLAEFRSRFLGKASPIHFFWGSFDLAHTRFSGRRAPEHPSVPGMPDRVVREAYSHECSSVGFWPGGGSIAGAAFYAYAYPEPAGYREAPIQPAKAFFSKELAEFILLYDDMRELPDPDQALLDFAQSTYEAAADLGRWNRPALERASEDPSPFRERPRACSPQLMPSASADTVIAPAQILS